MTQPHDQMHEHAGVHEHGDAPEHELDHADEQQQTARDDGHRHAGIAGFIGSVVGHSHDPADAIDDTLTGDARGIRAVKLSLVGLGITAVLQLGVVLISGSVALLADTIHNFSDALTAIPLWIAFVLGARAATRRYTFGYRRAEDLAGLFVLLMIAGSAILAAYESIDPTHRPSRHHEHPVRRRGGPDRLRRQRGRRPVPDPGRQGDRVCRARGRRPPRPGRRPHLARGPGRRRRCRARLPDRGPARRAAHHGRDPVRAAPGDGTDARPPHGRGRARARRRARAHRSFGPRGPGRVRSASAGSVTPSRLRSRSRSTAT